MLLKQILERIVVKNLTKLMKDIKVEIQEVFVSQRINDLQSTM